VNRPASAQQGSSEVTKPLNLQITGEQFQAMVKLLAQNPTDLLLSEPCRRYLARSRWQESSQQVRVHDDPQDGVMPGTISHNRRETEEGLFGSSRRTLRLINPLSSLEPVYSRAAKLKVLSIGPRTEMELLHLMGVGFQLPNITAIDLVSSSPLIDTGDMHAMPYPDRSFDVVISSWVLGYSSSPQKAVDEMIRVCVHGGLVAIGLTYELGYGTGVISTGLNEKDIVGSMYSTAAELETMMGVHLDRTFFQQDPGGSDRGPVMIISRIKHPNG
jgi:hypothetical protein